MGTPGNWRESLQEASGEPNPSPEPRGRRTAWVIALGLFGGLTAGVWVGVERDREAAARSH